MAFFSFSSSRSNQSHYKNFANNISAVLAETVDAEKFDHVKSQIKSIVDASEDKPLSDEWGSDRWNAYIAQFDGVKETQDYKDILASLKEVAAGVSSEVSSLYLSYVDPVNRLFVYVADSAEEDPCPPGCLDPIYDFNQGVIDNPEIGFPAYTTNTAEYGHLVTAGTAVHYNGNVIGYAVVDVSMEAVRDNQATRIVELFVQMVIVGVILIALSLLIVHFAIARPIHRLKNAANTYSEGSREEAHEAFTKLKVNTGDELTDLAISMRAMENDIHTQINELTRVNNELIASQEETKRMSELANTDAHTGVSSKIAYYHDVEKIDAQIREGQNVVFGIAMIDLNDLKEINDELGHEYGDIALVNLVNLLHKHFPTSPIYRVGGDEFVVIFTGKEYDEAESHIQAFNKDVLALSQDQSLGREKRTSAALGYVTFDRSGDNTVEDAFKRADKKMYQRKVEMKRARLNSAK